MFKKILTLSFILALFCLFNANMTAAPIISGNYEYYLNEDGNTITLSKYLGNEVNVVIPSELDGYDVSKLSNTFDGNNTVKSIEIPYNGRTAIYFNSFRGCANLEKVILPKIFIYMEDAFTGCTSLKEIIVPEDTTTLKSVDGVLYNKDMTTLLICPNGITGEFVVPASVNALGYMGDDAFSGCEFITNIVIHDGVTWLGGDTFENCKSLESITIPKGVQGISGQIFRGCTNLKNIYIDKDNEYYKSVDGIVYSKDGSKIVRYPTGRTDTKFTIPNSVTEIKLNAFADCYSLTEVYLPDTITTVEGFYNCINLVTITIPSSVTKIESWAFAYCKKLEEVIFEGDALEVDRYTFYEVNPNFTIYYTDGTQGWTTPEFNGLKCYPISQKATIQQNLKQ